jgi:cellulose synthase/poly-beta-1,6-N-acetylglucosamine synthase-like glycosyltransferase/peptidoglycan/xylan/chitin deacetylase (PgdA/CDA1 family)/spore germination protein YaaH
MVTTVPAMAKSVFYDPERKRWGRLRVLLSVLGAVISGLVLFFIVTVFVQADPLPRLSLPEQKRNLRALKERERRRPKPKGTHRKTTAPPSQVVLNTDEGIRAAYYVTWDAASFVSLKEYYPQVDILFPEWLHVLTPDGHLQGFDTENRPFRAIENGTVRSADDRVMPFLRAEKAEVEVFPLINNFEPVTKQWLANIGDFLSDPVARQSFRSELLLYLASDRFKGASLDFEEIPLKAQPGFLALVEELGRDLHARGLRLYVNVPVADKDFDYARLAAASDGLVIMNYDQHQTTSTPGPVAAQDWFISNLRQALKDIPKTRIICAIGSYGYDWGVSPRSRRVVNVDTNNVQEAWLHARESGSEIELDPDSLNPHFAYEEDNRVRHEVWYLDAVTALNQMRSARDLGIRTFALWRLGSEDRSLWKIWDNPTEDGAEAKLKAVPPGEDVDREGYGEILMIQRQPSPGEREMTLDADTNLVILEKMTVLPEPYQLRQFGWKEKEVAITFDDGPDPVYTPQVLDILKSENAPATFFLIGLQTQKFPGLARRIYDEGHGIGNHTFTHPDISDVSQWYMKRVELQLTEKLFASTLGVKPQYFRPPYSIDQEPDVADQVRPLELVQSEGYITVGSKIDPNDWRKGESADAIVAAVMAQAQSAATKGCETRAPLYCGNIILLHDGGGDRTATIQALPAIIAGLRARGFRIVSVEELLGKTRSDVMPRLPPDQVLAARLQGYVFTAVAWLREFVVLVFFIGDVLMSARLLGIGALATYDRLRKPAPVGGPDYKPPVTVIVPAFNEEKVIENTVRSVLASDYPRLRTIVADDGSTDSTSDVVREKFSREIAQGRVLLLTRPNAGKAGALNQAMQHTDDEIYIGIDADTVIAPTAISILVPHFADPKVGAVAGNAKVGNRVNLWTRWQALEYITSQNFERRALNVFGAVSVVPGAIGAWRVAAVRQAGGYHTDTVAEDADLTMSLLENGWRVINEDRALAFTEAPTSASGLMRQRFRWSFGILQAVWKHGAAIRKRSRLGWIALPNIIIFQILLPLVSPFIDIMFLFGTLEFLATRYFHPESTDPSSFERLAFYFAIFLAIDFVASALAFLLERRVEGIGEDPQLLLHLWLQRFSYRQLFSAVLVKTVKRAIDGKPFAWDKLERTAAVSKSRALEGSSS